MFNPGVEKIFEEVKKKFPNKKIKIISSDYLTQNKTNIEMLREIEKDFDIQFILDDRQEVVDMWRQEGYRCLQVAPGDLFENDVERMPNLYIMVGPSGAGKSTTQKILFRLLQGYEGSVQVFDQDLSEWGYEYFEKVGVSFEMPNHYTKLSGVENQIGRAHV